jgi:DNA mismatch repair protein MSH4
LSQITDNQTYAKTTNQIHVRGPGKILLQAAECPPSEPGTIYNVMIENMAPTCKIIPIERRLWSENVGITYVNQLAYEDEVKAVQVAIHGKFYAISAFSAVRLLVSMMRVEL